MVVARHFREMDLVPDVYSLDEVRGLKAHSSYWPGRDYTNRPNVVARRCGNGRGRSLSSAAISTPFPLAQRWAQGPFGGQIEDGRLYGLVRTT